MIQILAMSAAALLLVACEAPNSSAVKSARRVALGSSIPAGAYVHAHKGTTVFTNETTPGYAPGLDVTGMLQGAIGGGRSVTRIPVKTPSGRKVSPQPDCDIQIMLHENTGISEFPKGSCLRVTENAFGIKSDRGVCQLEAEVYSGETGELLTSTWTVCTSDRGLQGAPAVFNAARLAVNDIVSTLGLNKLPTTPATSAESEERSRPLSYRRELLKALGEPEDSSISNYYKKAWESNKRNWAGVRESARKAFSGGRKQAEPTSGGLPAR